jgi:inosose dehydratase
MRNALERRHFLRIGFAGALAAAGQPTLFAQSKAQKFNIGMAATEWLSAKPPIAYWTAVEAISALDFGATEADNSLARLDIVYGKDVSTFTEKLKASGVKITGVYQALPLHEAQRLDEMRAKIHAVASFLKAAGASYIALGWEVPWHQGQGIYQRTPEDVKQAVRSADDLGRIAIEEHGIPIALHAERDIPKEMVVQILDDTNPKYVRLCADVGHLTAMGLDALATVKKYSTRLTASHWKDYDPNAKGRSWSGKEKIGDFVELGKGVVDFHGLADFYREIGFDGWVLIELDQSHEPTIHASAQKMRSYVTDELKLKVYPRQRS